MIKYIDYCIHNYDELNEYINISDYLDDNLYRLKKISNYLKFTKGLYDVLNKDKSFFYQSFDSKYNLIYEEKMDRHTHELFYYLNISNLINKKKIHIIF